MKISVLASLLIAACICNSCFEIDDTQKIYVARYPGNKSGAVSLTFDDNCPSSITAISPLLKEYDYRATFFVISQRVKNWQPWIELSKEGFEIGNHTCSHVDLTSLNREALEFEVRNSRDTIAAHIGQIPVTFAHPGHRTNGDVDSIVFKHHLFSRMSPLNFCEWHGIISSTPQKDIFNHINRASRDHKWYVMAAHGIRDGFEPITEDFLRSVLEYLKTNEEYLVVDNFKTIATYRREAEATRVIVTPYEAENRIVVELYCPLDPEIYNMPLTVVIQNPTFPKDFYVVSLTGQEAVLEKNGYEFQIKTAPTNKFEIRWE